LVGAETLVATNAATFNSKDVATANLVTVNSIALSDGANGGLASNYFLTSGQTVAALITPKPLTATATAVSRVYDGTTQASVSLGALNGLVGNETLNAAAFGTFNSKDVIDANLVTVNSVTLADGTNGGLASNYFLASGQTSAANITPRPITILGDRAHDKFYDGTRTASLSGGSLSGILNGDNVSLIEIGEFASADVGNNIAVVTNHALTGLDAANYSLTQPSGLTANITSLAFAAKLPTTVSPDEAIRNAVGESVNTPHGSPQTTPMTPAISLDAGTMVHRFDELNLTVITESEPGVGTQAEEAEDRKRRRPTGR
jgi:hypothetical protein